MDKVLNVNQHIRNMCRIAAFGIHKVEKLQKCLDQSSTHRLVNAFVTSHLDYCNGLFDLPSSHLAPLQHIQNTAARLITRTRKHEHITPIIRSLHWLPLQQRIKFKIIMLTYKAFHKLAPSYLSALTTPKTRTSSMRLRSSSTAHLHLAPGPRTHTRYGNRAISVCAPQLWNNLLHEIRESPTLETFKSKPKTYMFNM